MLTVFYANCKHSVRTYVCTLVSLGYSRPVAYPVTLCKASNEVMANPKHSLSRVDLRPAAGAEPAVPAWAKDDYVLSRWIKEERARRRRFLADQVLEHSEPRIHYRPQNTIGDRIFGPIRNAFKPLDVATVNENFVICLPYPHIIPHDDLESCRCKIGTYS